MKRIMLLLLVLLAMTLPALGESPAAQSVVTTAYPGATILASAEDGDDAFFVLDMGDYKPRRLCGLTLIDGAWTLVIDSDTAVLPDYFENEYRQWRMPYTLIMALTEDELTLHYRKNAETETFLFRRSEDEWRFVRYECHDLANEMLFTTDWDGYALTEHRIDDRGDVQTPPCPMPWLAEEVSLEKFNARTFPVSLWNLTDEQLARVAALLLPEYTYKIGKFGWDAASFLMTRPDGEVIFCGGVYKDGAWVWTESTPLPEDTWCDDYHSGGSSFIIGWDHPKSEPDGLGYFPHVEYVIYLQEDGSWQVESVMDYYNEWFHFEPEGLYINMTGLVYGESSLERDVTKIDWATYPLCLEDVLPTMSHDWGVISEPTLPLYADPDETILLAEYHCATPVHILEEADDLAEKGWEGHLVKVQIADSDVVGWLPAYGVLTGQYQVWEAVEEDEDGEWVYYETAEYNAPGLLLAEGASLYAAPEGEPLWTAQGEEWLVFMADYGDGWAHVKCRDSLESGFIRLADCVEEE
ncbi:MAG: hypothetical protein IKK57_08395 [Clostridia bacterium]|nr:hypothetical protein [Clostridia bacterium]